MMAFKFNVKGNVNIKRRFIVNGREYASVEEMPEDIRHAYEQAMASMGREAHGVNLAGPQTRVVFNGEEYGSLDEMPEDIRQLYNAAMTTVQAHGSVEFGTVKAHEAASAPPGPAGSANTRPPSIAPIEVGGGSTSSVLRAVIAAIVVLMLLGALYYLDILPR